MPNGDLRKSLQKECHDTMTTTGGWSPGNAPHNGLEGLLLAKDDVCRRIKYVRTCQQDKVERAKAIGLLEPLPVPDRPWSSVSMD